MKSHEIIKNPNFVGRKTELATLTKARETSEASIIVVYGRRRVGKTELIEQFFRRDFVLKFEGIQSDRRRRRSSRLEREYQIRLCLRRLAKYAENPLLAKIECSSWTEFFELLDPMIKRRSMVLYFEEIQWLSNYSSEFLAEMKPFWDDRWRRQEGLIIVFCGSAPSFMTGEFMADKAFYARSRHEIHLKEFSLLETRKFMGVGAREAMLAQLSVGGIPEYLKVLKDHRSVLFGLCENSFRPTSFFSREQARIFVSSLSWNPRYRAIIEYLSRTRYAVRDQIRTAVGMGSGGSLSALLTDLQQCGFVEKYTPLYLGQDSLAARYCISDAYLQFYHRFVAPLLARIDAGDFLDDPLRPLNMMSFRQSLGFAFERWCRRHSHLVARILGFDRIEYVSGAFFNRATAASDQGFQIDLAFIRRDSRVVICEVKYTESSVDAGTVADVERRIRRFQNAYSKCRNYTFETALVTTEDAAAPNLRSSFDHVITFADLFDERHY
ncbi:MAG: AAA family ATPase [Kiritimatiellae bacterium]|nr:AAA family ATPase [Kiritimatiellia bacterium]